MGYRLRTDLNKTTVYNIAKAFSPGGFHLPVMRGVEFKKYKGTYWMQMENAFILGHGFSMARVILQACGGSVKLEYCACDIVGRDIFRHMVTVPFEYLQENGLLKEVA